MQTLEGLAQNSDMSEDEFPPGQMEFYESHSGIDGQYDIVIMVYHRRTNSNNNFLASRLEELSTEFEAEGLTVNDRRSCPAVPEMQAQSAERIERMPTSLAMLPREDLAPLLDVSDTLNWYRQDAEKSRLRTRTVERAHHSLLLQYEELLAVNEELMAALEAAGLPIP